MDTAQLASLFEAVMIIAFGLSWPLNIIKSLQTKSTKGKSLLFLILIDLGYVFGILAKIISGNITYVFAFYIFNFVMVSADLVLYFINRKRERAQNNKKGVA